MSCSGLATMIFGKREEDAMRLKKQVVAASVWVNLLLGANLPHRSESSRKLVSTARAATGALISTAT